MSKSMSELAENKLIILYLIHKMSIPLSNNEICYFALEKNYMDYFSIQQYLSELVDCDFLELTQVNNTKRYSLTDEGIEVITFFIDHITDLHKREINNFVLENKGRVRTEYDVTANYFSEINNDFLVKCGICEGDGTSVIELSILVPTKEQAQNICKNWKSDYRGIYKDIMDSLVLDRSGKDSSKDDQIKENTDDNGAQTT